MDPIVVVWFALGSISLGFLCAYYIYMKLASKLNWDLKVDRDYLPNVSILVPTHNEEKMIELKLRNISRLLYDKSKMQVIVADDASTDRTVEIANRFATNHPELQPSVLRNEKRLGKSRSLNSALKEAKHEVVVLTDADVFLDPKVLIEALPYLADPSVGAVIGRQNVLNPDSSLSTKFEDFYLNLAYDAIRLGQSKMHSTVVSHGSFGAFKRSVLQGFNVNSDDSGTALDVVQRGARIIYVPEVITHDLSPLSYEDRFSIKIRRANHNIRTYARCFKLLLTRDLMLPKRIALPEIFLYILNPLIFLAFAVTTLIMLFFHLPYSLFIPTALLLVLLNSRSRLLLIETIEGNTILFLASLMLLLGKGFISWRTRRDSQTLFLQNLLQKKELI